MNYRHSVLASAIVWSLAAMSGTTLGNASVSNLANPDLVTYADRATTDYSPRQAESFTTGSAAGVLVSITIFGANDAGSPTLFTPILFADAGGRPGSTIVETLLTYSYTGYTTPTPITFPAAGATSLLPNTTYWFSLLSDHVAVWYPTSSGTETSDYGWTLGDDHWSYGAQGWVQGGTFRPMRLAVDATILPEPSVLAISLLSLAVLGHRVRRRA